MDLVLYAWLLWTIATFGFVGYRVGGIVGDRRGRAIQAKPTNGTGRGQ